MSQARAGLPASASTPAWMPSLSPPLWIAAIALAAAAALLPGIWTLAGLSALSLCILILIRPELAVYLLALSVPLGSLLEVKLGNGLTVSPTEGLAALLAIGWIARALSRRRLEIPMTPLTIPLVAMIAIVVSSVAQATDLALTAKESLKWLELLLVYMYVVAEMRSPRKVLTLVGFLLAGALIEAAIGLTQFALGLGPEPFAIGRFMRAYGTFEQPNPYAGYLGMLIPLAVGYLLTRPGTVARNTVLAICLLALAAVGASLSRGAWVGIALAFGVMMVFWNRRSKLLLSAGALATAPVAALAFLNMLPDEITSRLATAVDYFRFIDVRNEVATPENWAVIERVAHWQAALDMISAHPLFGVGAGNYPAVYEFYMVEGWKEPLGHAHNFYLNITAETGVFGFLVYATILIVAGIQIMTWLVRSGRIAARMPKPASRTSQALQTRPLSAGEGGGPISPHRHLWRGILLGVMGSLVASGVHNMFDSLFVHSMSVQLGMILALAQVAATALAGRVSSRGQPA